jgi:hypothetical protein
MVMGLRARHWPAIKESSMMKGAKNPQKVWRVMCRFEPDRLSSTRQADAYEIILPRNIRIMSVDRAG